MRVSCAYLAVLLLAIVASCDKNENDTARSKTPSAGAADSDASAESRVIKIVGGQFGKDESAITSGTRLKEDLKADELDLVELVMEAEDEFHISIADADAEKWKSVDDIIRTINSSPKSTAARTKR